MIWAANNRKTPRRHQLHTWEAHPPASTSGALGTSDQSHLTEPRPVEKVDPEQIRIRQRAAGSGQTRKRFWAGNHSARLPHLLTQGLWV